MINKPVMVMDTDDELAQITHAAQQAVQKYQEQAQYLTVTDEATEEAATIFIVGCKETHASLDDARDAQGEGGNGAGTGHPGLLTREFRVAELVRQLRLRYEPYRHRRARTREVPWPEDLDLLPLRSFSASDLTRISLADQLCTDAEFTLRLARRAVRQTIYIEPDPAPRRFVMLLDVSGSMQKPCGRATREEFAIASAICLLESALAGGHQVTLIRFDDRPYEPIVGTPSAIVQQLLRLEFSGGGTSIAAALGAADASRPDEILLVSDGGDDHMSKQPTAPLVTYLAGGDNEQLRSWSRSYHRIETLC